MEWNEIIRWMLEYPKCNGLDNPRGNSLKVETGRSLEIEYRQCRGHGEEK